MKKKRVKTASIKAGTRLKKAVKTLLSKAVPARKKRLSVPQRKKAVNKKTAGQTAASVKKNESISARPVSQLKDLPYSYNETTLVLLIRDPEWGYAYWDFSEKTWQWMRDFFKKDSAAKLKLRIYNLTSRKSFDIDIQHEAKNWYICFGHDNHEFEAEIGLLDSSGKFHAIARSNRIRTPRSKPSDKIDPNWDPKNFDELYRLSGGGQIGAGASSLPNFAKKNY